MASQITSLMIVYSTLIQAQIKENSKAPCHWLCERNSLVNSPHKGQVTRTMLPFDDVIMDCYFFPSLLSAMPSV